MIDERHRGERPISNVFPRWAQRKKKRMKVKSELTICLFVTMLFVMTAFCKEATSSLDGLFGVKFGKVMGVTEKCDTNNVGELAYEYTPAKLFRGFSDYVLFATPITRQVSQVRAVTRVNYDEVEKEMSGTVKVLEMKFGKTARSFDKDTKVIYFDNDDYISITKDGRRIIIDARCGRLRNLTKEEVEKAEKERYAEDVKVLALLPGKDKGEDKVYQIDSVFGIKFGEPMKEESNEQVDGGAWVHEFNPPRQFMGCQSYRTFTTEETKKVFFIRAVYEGNEYEARRDQMRRVIESVMGRKMRENDDKDLYMSFGDFLVTIEEGRGNIIFLDFVKTSLYKQNEKEHENVVRKAASADLDAL